MTDQQRRQLNRAQDALRHAAQSASSDPSDDRSDLAARTHAHDLYRLRRPQPAPEPPGPIVRTPT